MTVVFFFQCEMSIEIHNICVFPFKLFHSTMRKRHTYRPPVSNRAFLADFNNEIQHYAIDEKQRIGICWHYFLSISIHRSHFRFEWLIDQNRIPFVCNAFYDTTMNSVTHTIAIFSEWHVTCHDKVESWGAWKLTFNILQFTWYLNWLICLLRKHE